MISDLEASTSPESVGLCARRLQRIRAWMAAYVESGRLPGALTLVARHGRIAFLEAVGQRDREAGAALGVDSIARFYSMAKPVTTVAALMLYEEGRFQLDDPLDRYLPCFADTRVWNGEDTDPIVTVPARRPLQIRDLMTHTSGITYGSFDETPVDALYREHGVDFSASAGTLADTVERLGGMPLLCHPGEAWNYGASTDVLGRLVEVLSGEPLDRFLATRIFAPLGMHDSGFCVPTEKQDRFTALYAPTGDRSGIELRESPTESRFAGEVTLFSGGGGLLSTCPDYFRFTEMLRQGGELDGARLLGRKTVEHMTRNHLPGNVDMAAMGQPRWSETTHEGIGFGLGVSVMLDPAAAGVIGTPGEYSWGGAASTTFWIDPVEDLTVIFVTQLIPSSTYPLRRELRTLTYQALID